MHRVGGARCSETEMGADRFREAGELGVRGFESYLMEMSASVDAFTREMVRKPGTG